jgi:hypothetical protein
MEISIHQLSIIQIRCLSYLKKDSLESEKHLIFIRLPKYLTIIIIDHYTVI